MQKIDDAPLIETEKETTPGLVESLKTVFKLAMWPIIGSLFHPVYTIVNAMVCGRMSETDLAGFGLGSLTLGIMSLSICACFSSSLGALVSQAAGAKEFRMCRVYLYRQ